MELTNREIVLNIMEDILTHDLADEKLHHYKLSKIQIMEALMMENNKSCVITDEHGALMMMHFAFAWWKEIGIIEELTPTGGGQ